MKRFWLVLLSLGLVMAFSVSAFAVDVKVSGEYFVGGLYLDRVDVLKASSYDSYSPSLSTAFFYQRMRVGTDFVVSPCLKLVTSFDAMERIWGGVRSNTWAVNQQPYDEYAAPNFSAGTRAETENIAFNQIYLEYTSPIGLFKIGYMPDYVFGTMFADQGNMLYSGQIQYFIQSGPFIGLVAYSKRTDSSYSAVSSTSWNDYLSGWQAWRTDRDYDSYRVAGIYEFKGNNVKGETGILFLYDRDATHRGMGADGTFGNSYITNVYALDPYVKAKIGPVSLQAEVQYWFGDAAKYEGYATSAGATNLSINALSVFVDANVNLGPAYVGGTFAYLSGDKPDANSKTGTGSTIEGGVNTGGSDFNPCLIMFNTETMGYWAGAVGSWTENESNMNVLDNQMSNAWFFQGRVGVKPTPQWDIMMSLAYATADQKPSGFSSGTYGTEVDLTAMYKITNNLSYMLGGGYLFTGDYFKGNEGRGANQVNDDFILINKLTLSF
jgi:hypothetical protein